MTTLFRKIVKVGIFPKSFDDANIIQIPLPDKDSKRKKSIDRIEILANLAN